MYTRGLHEVGDGIWAWLQPDGGWGWSNAGLVVGGESSLLVDTLFDLRLTASMLEEMRRRVPAARHIDTVVNTHANGDHCYGNQLVASSEIIASRAAALEMERVPARNLAAMMAAADDLGPAGAFLRRIFGPFDFEGITDVLPSRTFDGSLSLDVGEVAVSLLQLGPAHTEGDVVVVVPSRRVVFTGDLLFAGGHPIVWAGPVSSWIAALDRLLTLDVDTVVPGHGPVCDLDAVRSLRSYFVELLAAARPLWEEGMTALDAARRLHIDRAAGWGEAERLVVNVAACFRELGGGPGAADTMSLFGDMAALAGYH